MLTNKWSFPADAALQHLKSLLQLTAHEHIQFSANAVSTSSVVSKKDHSVTTHIYNLTILAVINFANTFTLIHN